MSTHLINLDTLVSPTVDSISGRKFGISTAKDENVVHHVQQNDKIVLHIDEKKVRAINDSFIKGFFAKVFELLRTKDRVKQQFEIQANDYYKRLFEKNWSILEAIYAPA